MIFKYHWEGFPFRPVNSGNTFWKVIFRNGCYKAPKRYPRITRIEITRVESPTFDGKKFAEVGQYEKIVGKAYGEVDPDDPKNAIITDIDLALRYAMGIPGF